MDEHEAPELKLTVKKGPSSGRVLDCKPRSKIHIGRVVRGNTLAIKDAGISSKHLAVQFESESGRWTVTDLDSSNGTVLNTESLKPSVPSALSDGDVIKIGELTDIEVKFEVKVSGRVKEEKKKEEGSRPRRITRRQATAEAVAGSNLGVIDENSELGVGLGFGEELREKNAGKGRGRRGRVPKKEVTEGRNQVEESENLGENVMRRTRSSKRGGDSENGEEMGNLVGGKVSLRRGRSSKKTEGLENGEETGNVVAGKVSLRRRRGGKEENVENKVEDDEGMKNLEVREEEKGRRIDLRRTRSSIKEDNLGEKVGNLDVVEGRRARNGRRGSKNVQTKELESVENGKIREEDMVEKPELGAACEGEEGNLEGDGATGMEEKEDMNVGREGDGGLASTSGVKETGVQVDLEKMTLGEWFDYLEEYLPKQIIDQTEDMILGMRQKAEKFHEFMLQQRAAKEMEEVSIV